jgi:hypothetical protein
MKLMPFLHRQRHLLLVLAALVLSSVLVVQQYLANESAHTARLEDFIVLHERGETKLAERRYQLLVQELPQLSERALVTDLQRTALIVEPNPPQLDSLLWKYQVGVKNELKRRAERRISRLLQEAQKE